LHLLTNKVSPLRDVTLLARRRVLLPGELRCAAVECDRRQRPLLVSGPSTLCVGGPVITCYMRRRLGAKSSDLFPCADAVLFSGLNVQLS